MCQVLDALVFEKNAGILVVCRGFLQTPRAQGVGADRLRESLNLGFNPIRDLGIGGERFRRAIIIPIICEVLSEDLPV